MARRARDDRTGIDPALIVAERERGWVNFHPEDYCHRCGRRNVVWFAPEWPVVMAEQPWTILCPSCFIARDPDAVWVITRRTRRDPGERQTDLAAFLRAISDLDDDAVRVASCLDDYLTAKGAYREWTE